MNRSTILFRVAPAALVLLAWMPATAGETTFPYKAFVLADEVYVRSGPGQSYYPTEKLRAGQVVEVYRHDPGGWYAIRPPEGSFSWVSGRYLELKDDGLAVVTEEGVAARVGSRFSDIRDVIQVRLSKGEVVEVLGRREGPNGPDGQTWFKIAPPSGEFRWVFGKYVDPQYPVDGLRRAEATGTDPIVSVDRADAVRAGAFGRGPRDEPIGASGAPVAAESAGHYGSSWRVAEAGAAMGGAPATDDLVIPTGGLSSEQFEEAIRTLDMELSAMVVEEPTVWNFDRLGRQAQLLLDGARTAVERGRARVLLSKIERFADIKRRHDAVLALGEQAEQTQRRLSALEPRAGQAIGAPDAYDQFDAVGQLTQVISSKPGAPRYALVDPRGEVACYLTPSPGVNLRHYLGRQVGVAGTRGYMPEQRATHITARHIRLLDGSAGATALR